jgi:hypothetical protein
MLVLIEDIHWADTSPLEFLRRLGSRIGQRRLLLIATHRPEFAAYAFVEAERHARRAIRLAELVTGATQPRAVLAATVLLGETLIATLGYANEQVLAGFERATEIAFTLGEARELVPSCGGLPLSVRCAGRSTAPSISVRACCISHARRVMSCCSSKPNGTKAGVSSAWLGRNNERQDR